MGRCKQASPKRRKVTASEENDDAKATRLENLFRDNNTTQDQQDAIATLLAAPSNAVEAAAAEATRIHINSWPCIDPLVPTITNVTNSTNDGTQAGTTSLGTETTLPSCLQGLAKTTLGETDFAILQDLHYTIQQRATEWTSWSGSPTDLRRRAFGFFPNSFLGLKSSSKGVACSKIGDKDETDVHPSDPIGGWNWRDQLDVSMPWQQPAQYRQDSKKLQTSHPQKNVTNASDDERSRNARSMVNLGRDEGDHDWLLSSNERDNDDEENSSGKLQANMKSAISNLLTDLRPHAPRRVQPYLSLKYLVAAQPNLHCGRHLLPGHVDHPQKDGFGICIVTIAMKGKAQIFLEESTVSNSTSTSTSETPTTATTATRGVMTIDQGQAYLLSGPARNQCTHGVLAAEECGDRESLNLRFGLHGVVLPDHVTNDDEVEVTAMSSGTSSVEKISADEVLQYW